MNLQDIPTRKLSEIVEIESRIYKGRTESDDLGNYWVIWGVDGKLTRVKQSLTIVS